MSHEPVELVNVKKYKAIIPIVVQVVWISVMVVFATYLPIEVWYIKLLMVIWIIPPVLMFQKTWPFLLPGSMTLMIDTKKMVLQKYGKTWLIEKEHLEGIELSPMRISIGYSNWGYVSVSYRKDGRPRKVGIPDAFSVDPARIYQYLNERLR